MSAATFAHTLAFSARKALLAWFRGYKRDLPWRRTSDPYAIWLSEVMLQQTRVETVVPYFERFLAEFPTVGDLARAPRERVLAAWAGLGYYRRARMLHDASMQIAQMPAFPGTVDELLQVHGIGPYTAGAVASIAFGEVAPLVDGNVQRVLSRLCNLDGDMRGSAGTKQAWTAAKELVDEQSPGDWNQALMELGARICTPTSPSCGICPVRAECKALAADVVALRPVMSPKKRPKTEALEASVLQDGSFLWLGRRRESLRFGGLWEPPVGAEREGEGWRLAGEVRHVLTHRVLEVRVYQGESTESACWSFDAASDYEELRLVAVASLGAAEIGLSTLAKKVLAVAGIDARRVRPRTRGLNEVRSPD